MSRWRVQLTADDLNAILTAAFPAASRTFDVVREHPRPSPTGRTDDRAPTDRSVNSNHPLRSGGHLQMTKHQVVNRC